MTGLGRKCLSTPPYGSDESMLVAEIGKRAEEATPGEAAGRPATVAIPLASPGAAVRARLSLVR